LASSDQLTLKAQNPEVVIKTSIPLNQEIKFTAQPYFFNIKSLDELDYNWNFGGNTGSQTSGNNPNILTIRFNEITESIKQNLTVWIKNISYPLQEARISTDVFINL